MSLRVTAVDTETGQTSEVTLEPGNYTVVTAHPCRLVGQEHHANGVSVLRLTGRGPHLLTTRVVDAECPS